jgi:CheY-like chemotaxis protein
MHHLLFNSASHVVMQQGSPPYDVVLMDLQMPIMDGPLAIRRLRATEAQMREDAAALSSPRGSGYGGGGLGAGSSGEYKHAGSFGYDGEDRGTTFGGAADGYGEGDGEGDLEQGLSSRVGQGSQRSLHARYHQFVVAVSANSDQETVDDALLAGADTFMTKPFAYETFAAIFEEHYKFGTIADF